MVLFQHGDFILHSGARSNFKIDCDALCEKDWEALAAIVGPVTGFSVVEGVPRGGLAFAEALKRYAQPDLYDRLLIVDDVYTTGVSMEAQRGGREATGVVLFSRVPLHEVVAWVTPVFSCNVYLR